MTPLGADKRGAIEPIGIPVAAVAAWGGPSRAECYRLIKAGKLRSYRLGRRRMVILSDLRLLVEAATAAA